MERENTTNTINSKQISKKEYEKYLLDHIDIPYFKNNPGYLEKWRSYYKSTKDPNVLSLMFFKKIGTLHHWIYVEFAEIFLKSNHPELANFIITLALDHRVYDKKVLDDQLKKIPSFKSQYSDQELYALINRKNIKCMGMVWNAEEDNSSSVYNTSSTYPSSTTINDKDLVSIEHTKSVIEIGDKIKIGSFYFEVTEIQNQKYFSNRISEGNENQQFCIQKIPLPQMTIFTAVMPCSAFLKFNESLFSIHRVESKIFLTEIFTNLDFKSSEYKFFYLQKILLFTIKCIKENFVFLDINGFYINEEFELRNEMEFLENATETNILKIKSELSKFYEETDFSFGINEIYKMTTLRTEGKEFETSLAEHKKTLIFRKV